jgi:AraC-like DNA-binding protein
LSLPQVAQFAYASPFYFCKLFKRATGLTFTNFLSCVRIERSKNLLINPQLRVSEIAYEVGFQSLTHFNRVFQKLLGQSPTEYRLKVQGRKPPDCG